MKIWRSANLKMGVETPEQTKWPLEFMFLRDNRYWEPHREINEMHLRNCITHATQLQATRGILFLNEFLNIVGIERISAGQTSGWLTIDPDIEIDRFGEGYRIICWVERDIHLALDEDAH